MGRDSAVGAAGHAEWPGRAVPTSRDAPPGEAASEFICLACGRPLHLTLRSDICFAEAQIYCADCEREYQERRGRWAPEAPG